MFYPLFALLGIYALFTLAFAATCFKEGSRRAGLLGGLAFVLLLALLFFYGSAQGAGLLSGGLAEAVQGVLALGLLLFTVSLFLPLGRNRQALSGTRGMAQGPPERFNQKDTAFNRAHVGGFGPEVGRKRWSLQSRDPYGGIYWTLVMGLRGHVDGKVNPIQGERLSPKEMTARIKEKARYLGADLVGITSVKEDFTYTESFSYEESKLEVGPAVTHPVDLRHRYVIVLAKEMDFGRIQTTLTEGNEESLGEVGKTYYEVAQIACALASHIRQLGYSARAHHLRNEQIFHIPHAVDTGLGEQGMFNYLITRKYGPRVRMASVSTDLELVEDRPVDIGVQDFCDHCRICETNCPPKAIKGEREIIRGFRKWSHDPDKCFLFWVSGDNTFACSQCLKVCPWNKPDAFVHRVSFMAASRSVVARRLLYWLHVIFYGKRYHWRRIPLTEEVEMPPETSGWKR